MSLPKKSGKGETGMSFLKYMATAGYGAVKTVLLLVVLFLLLLFLDIRNSSH